MKKHTTKIKNKKSKIKPDFEFWCDRLMAQIEIGNNLCSRIEKLEEVTASLSIIVVKTLGNKNT